VIQPGPIKTRFGDTAVGSIAMPPNSPYAAFNVVLEKQIREAYEGGPMARFAAPPKDVAEVIEKAITATNPKTRYKVTLAAHVLMGLRSVLPDRAFDAFLRSQFPPPTL
jgi:hypothetical protein